MSRSGLDSCDAVKSDSCSRSSTMRVVPGCVSAIRICFSRRSPTATVFCAITGRAPCTSKNRRGGFSRWSDLNLNSPETSTATRVVSAVVQKRTAVTLLAAWPKHAMPKHTSSATAKNLERIARNRLLLRGPEMQPAFGIDERLQFRVSFLRHPNWRSGRLRQVLRGCLFRCSVLLADPVNIILRFGIRRNPLVFLHSPRPGVVGCQREAVVFVQVLQVLKITYSGLNVLARVETVAYAQVARRGRHELHQALGSLGRKRVGVIVALHLDDGMHQKWIDIVIVGGFLHDFGNVGRGKRLGCGRAFHRSHAANQFAGTVVGAHD